MHRLDSLTWHVMDALADDWESVVQIRPHVHQYCGATSDKQIFDALRQLYDKKLVEIMKVDGQAGNIFQTHPEACWFGMTDAGRAFWDSESAEYRDDDKA
jgi:hypothetical protein